jgi:Helix-turn-helix domain
MSIPAVLHVLKHSKAKQSHFNVLMWLANHADEDGDAWPSVQTLVEESGYKPRWVKTVLEDLVRPGEVSREKAGRSYRYRLPRYDSKHKTCTCAVTAPMEPPAYEQVRLLPGQVHLIPPQVHLLPQQVQSPDANPSRHQENPTEPVCEPALEPAQEPDPPDVGHEADKTPDIRALVNGFCGRHPMPLGAVPTPRGRRRRVWRRDDESELETPERLATADEKRRAARAYLALRSTG